MEADSTESLKDEPAGSVNTILWLVGRGASIECGLSWQVPSAWRDIPRDEKIERIKNQVRVEMEQPAVSGAPYRTLLGLLERGSRSGWRHRFVTTNWDHLLQREVLRLGFEYLPAWLRSSHVAHLNGTVEILQDNSHRSPFLLEEDSYSQRNWTVEANVTFNQMILGHHFVVLGMSFECETDRFLLHALERVENYLPVGESHWIIVNPDVDALDRAGKAIRAALPSATIELVNKGFSQWLSMRAPELQMLGVLNF